jgi:DNA-binding NarL/FixJ family response regulator
MLVPRAAEKRRPMVCLLSAHPLVLGELKATLAKSSAQTRAVEIPSGWRGQEGGVSVPEADVYVLDGQSDRASAESLLGAVLRTHPQAAVVVMASEFSENAAFPLLRLGARGLIRFSDVGDQLPRAVEATAGGNYWVPRTLLSRFVDSLVGRGGAAAGEHAMPEAGLSAREQQVLDGLLENLSNKEIGSRLNITERTVKFHVSHILAKFQVQRRADLILRFYQHSSRKV